MVSAFLETARKFTARYEENEVNEFNAEEPRTAPIARRIDRYEENEVNEEMPPLRLNSLSSFNSYQPPEVHRAKVQILASQGFRASGAWCQAIRAGIRYASEGRVNPAAILEDIEVWRELAANHGWPPAPDVVASYEENEVNELKGAA